ncbi:hypothetical protein D9Q98_003943 [Chlorella vulgaris]|uniref:serine O-acetyltransferase n=1 Tax=Chlorella vulgaris TaxID=3077 RepID=A0A9D4YYK1_CHLVU|nr:hypothetical protein D9Q98_003943 [Chlorella vulgaris]
MSLVTARLASHTAPTHGATASQQRAARPRTSLGGKLQAAGGSPHNGASPLNGGEDGLWETSSIPEYMQQDAAESEELCESWEATLRGSAAGGKEVPHTAASAADILWQTIRREAQVDAAAEPLLSSFLYASILSHDSFERSLSFVLSNRLSSATFLSTELFEVFYSILRTKPLITEAALADIAAVRERDPACMSYSQALLHFKGFHAIEAHRIAHELWVRGRRVMAVALQSRMSEVFAVDIHPAASFGKGILLDHGTGVVIGETAQLGNNVSILQNVTLGGTGKVHGDRHPKISDNVLIGASASILGNIRVGKGAQVAAGSLVLKPVPPRTLVAGSPAKEIGTIKGNPALRMEQWCIDNKEMLRARLADDPFAAPPNPSKSRGSSASSSSSGETPTSGSSSSAKSNDASSSSSSSEDGGAAGAAAARASNGAVVPPVARQQSGAGPAQQQPAVEAGLSDSSQQQPQQVQPDDSQQQQGPGAAGKPSSVQQPPAATTGGKAQVNRKKGKVDAVTSDSAAQKKWPAKKSSPPEYFI